MISGQIVDAIIIIYIGYAIFVGFARGFFSVIVGIFGIYGASILAWLFQERVLGFSSQTLGVSASENPSIAFICVWVFFYLSLTVGAKILTSLLNLTGMSILLRFSGGLFNGLKAVLIVIVVLTFISNLNSNLFKSTTLTSGFTTIGAKVMNLYSESMDENKIEVGKELRQTNRSVILDDDFRYNLLER